MAERSSELWFWRTVTYLELKQHDKRQGREGRAPTPKPNPAEVDAAGNWFIGAGEVEGAGDGDEG